MKNAVVLSLFLAACATTTSTTNDADAYIRSAGQRFISAFNAGNADAVAGFYADDAVLLLPNSPIARGSAAVRATMGGMAGMHPSLDFSPDRISQSGDMAYEVGHYTMTVAGNRDQGDYVAVWRRQPGGDWKMVADSVVSSMPAMVH
jgi:ketosteroid isomerase-like protein